MSRLPLFPVLCGALLSGPVWSQTAITLPLRIGGAGADTVRDTAVDPRGNLVVTGTFTRNVDFNPAAPEDVLVAPTAADMFLAKYDANGRYVWAVRIGGPGVETPRSIAADAQGNILVCGIFNGVVDFDPSNSVREVTSRQDDIFLAKYSPDGALLWLNVIGSALADEAFHLKLDATGSVYMTGYFQQTVDLDPVEGRIATITSQGQKDLFLAKYSPAGDFQWGFGVGFNFDEIGYGIAFNAAGNVVLYGTFASRIVDFDPSDLGRNLTRDGNIEFPDLFLAVYSADGGVHLGSQRFGGVNSDIAAPGGVWVDSANNIVITGTFNVTTNFEPAGRPGGIRNSNGGADAFLARIDSQFNFRSAISWGGAGNDTVLRLATGADNAAYVAGAFVGTADFDPGAGTSTVTARGVNGATDGYLARYNADGTLGWVVGLGGTPSSSPENLAAASSVISDGRGFWLVSGTFFGTLDTDPGAGVVPIVTEGESDGYVIRYSSDGRLVRDLEQARLIAAVTATSNGVAGPLVGGSAHTIWGNALAGSTAAFADLPLPTRLCDIQVRIRDSAGREFAAPLYYCSAGQVNFLAPFELATGPADVSVVNDQGSRVTATVNVSPLNPSIFLVDAAGTGAVIFGAGPLAGRLVNADNPVRPGDILLVYAGGLGAVEPALVTGARVDGIARTLVNTGVRIGGVDARVDFSGYAPGGPGAYQINVVVPQGLTPGIHPLVLTTPSGNSNSVPVVVR
ncbi:MAG: hypothetical protein K2X35_08955 [Bryobacteraceae bacterium]|nr:hypothetical protein [Bryobacteraceae bacterium]